MEAIRAGVCAIMVPKVETISRIAVLAEILSEIEEAGDTKPVGMIPPAESARGLQIAHELATLERA